MIKSVIKLTHDLNAKAGQLLVHHEDGNVYAVDRIVMDSASGLGGRTPREAVASPVRPAREPIKTNRPSSREPSVESVFDDLLLRNVSPSNVARATNLPLIYIKQRAAVMIEQGLIPGDNNQKRIHHWYKTPESLEGARNRALHMVKVTKARKAAQ